MFNAETIHEEIVAELKKNFNNLAVKAYPDKPQDYLPSHPIGEILVLYKGSMFDDSTTMVNLRQARYPNIDIHIITRELNGERGVLHMLNVVRGILSQFKAKGCLTTFWQTNEQMVGNYSLENKLIVWEYTQSYRTKTFYIPGQE
jgi:hypothetical protein